MAQWADMEALENKYHASLSWFFDSLGAIRQISSLGSASSRVVTHRHKLSVWFSASMSTKWSIRRVSGQLSGRELILSALTDEFVFLVSLRFRVFFLTFESSLCLSICSLTEHDLDFSGPSLAADAGFMSNPSHNRRITVPMTFLSPFRRPSKTVSTTFISVYD